MKYTTNYGFKKPEPLETRNVNDFNDSFDLVDAALKETQDKNVNLDATFQELIINAGSSNAELVAAHHDNVTGETFASIPARMDSNSRQLVDIATQVDNFGAKGDGITNDTQAIKDAFLYCKNNKSTKLQFSHGKEYVIDEPIINTKSDLEIEGNNCKIKWINETKLTGNFVLNRERHFGFLTMLGEEKTEFKQNLLSFENAIMTTRGFGSKLTVPNDTFISIGNYLHIGTAIGANLTEEYKAGFDIIAKVVNKIGSDIYIDYFSPFDFSGVVFTTYFCNKLNNIDNVKIKNFILDDKVEWYSPAENIEGPNLNKCVCGIGINYGTNIKMENIKGINGKFPTIMVQYGHTIESENIYNEDPNYIGGGQGYTTHYCGVMNGIVDKVGGANARHITDFSYSAFCTLRNMKNSTTYNKAFDLHGIWEHDITIENSSLTVAIGNGKENFPLMNGRIKFTNCNIGEIVTDSNIFDLDFTKCNISLASNPIYCNDIVFNDCKVQFYSTPTISKKLTNGKRGIFKANNTKIYNYSHIAIAQSIKIQDYDLVEFNKCEMGTDELGIILSLFNLKDSKFNNTLFNNTSLRVGSDNVALESRSILFENCKHYVNENINTFVNKLIRMDELVNSKVLLTYSNNKVVNDVKVFSSGAPLIPYYINATNGNTFEIIVDNNYFINNSVSHYTTTNFFINNSAGITHLSAKGNKYKNFWYKSNIADKYLTSTTSNVGNYNHFATITGTNGSATLAFEVNEIKNAFSAKYANCVISIYRDSTSNERIMFYCTKANAFVSSDIVYTRELVGSDYVYKLYVKTLSIDDYYSIVKKNEYVFETYKINLFDTNSIVTLLTSPVGITIL